MRVWEAGREQIEQLVDAVHGHARTLALLAPSLKSRGVENTRLALVELMADMERNFPGSREKSLFAGVELSLRRLSPENRKKARVLGVFHGGVSLTVLHLMMKWEMAELVALANELIATGLATPNPDGHLSLNPALCPYLRGRLEAEERTALAGRWDEAMRRYVGFLVQQSNQDAELAAILTALELPNLFALLERVERARDAEATIDLTTKLFSLLQFVGKPRLLERVARVREAAAARLGVIWNHARFETQRTRIEQQLGEGGLRAALEGARELLQRARTATYPGADYDLAMACLLLARVLNLAGDAESALPLLDEAEQGFEAITQDRANPAAERMASLCLAERGNCLHGLGRFDGAAAAYEENIRRAEKLDDERQVTVGKIQLGTVRLSQRRYPEARQAFEEAWERFTRLDEPSSVATVWHQIGMVYEEEGQPEAAEEAYRKSLAIEVGLENVVGQAATLLQLGNLYGDKLGRTEEAVAFHRQAADKYGEIRDAANEGRARGNLAIFLSKLRRLDEARQEILRVIECFEQCGHNTGPWRAWDVLADIETDSGHPSAAAEARQKAIDLYLAYRRDGGENHSGSGRICLAVTKRLRAGDAAGAAALLREVAAHPDLPAEARPFIQALQAIVAGRRDRALAENPELDYSMAAEILFLIETLAGR